MDEILICIKKIIVFILLKNVCQNLINKEEYIKIYKLITGFILILIIVSFVTSLKNINVESLLTENIANFSDESIINNFKENLKNYENTLDIRLNQTNLTDNYDNSSSDNSN